MEPAGTLFNYRIRLTTTAIQWRTTWCCWIRGRRHAPGGVGSGRGRTAPAPTRWRRARSAVTWASCAWTNPDPDAPQVSVELLVAVDANATPGAVTNTVVVQANNDLAPTYADAQTTIVADVALNVVKTASTPAPVSGEKLQLPGGGDQPWAVAGQGRQDYGHTAQRCDLPLCGGCNLQRKRQPGYL